jgi:hypothetical protein
MLKSLIMKKLPENAVSCPRSAAGNKLAVRSRQTEAYGVKHFLIVWDEVHFVTVHYAMERKTTQVMGSVWKRLDYASVFKAHNGPLRHPKMW